jgi:hypothetical protein
MLSESEENAAEQTFTGLMEAVTDEFMEFYAPESPILEVQSFASERFDEVIQLGGRSPSYVTGSWRESLYNIGTILGNMSPEDMSELLASQNVEANFEALAKKKHEQLLEAVVNKQYDEASTLLKTAQSLAVRDMPGFTEFSLDVHESAADERFEAGPDMLIEYIMFL